MQSRGLPAFIRSSVLKWTIIAISFLIAVAAFYCPPKLTPPGSAVLAAPRSESVVGAPGRMPPSAGDRTPRRYKRDRMVNSSTNAVGATGIRG